LQKTGNYEGAYMQWSTFSFGYLACAINTIYRRAYRYLERLSDEIDRFGADIQKIANGIIPDYAPSSSPGPTSSPESIPISRRKYVTVPLEPQQEVFVYVKHWTPKEWNALRDPKKGTVSGTPNKIDRCPILRGVGGRQR
jgi:hypothetical protein